MVSVNSLTYNTMLGASLFLLSSPSISTAAASGTAGGLRGLSSSDLHGCAASQGYTYCDSLAKCIQPWMTNCPVTNGQSFHGSMTFSCTNGQCSDLTSTCNIVDVTSGDGAGVQLQGPSLFGLNGDYLLPAGCSVKCSNDAIGATSSCRIKDFPSPQTDGHGCKSSAGYSWCPETSKCVRFDENCPIENGTVIQGSKTLSCQSGARMSDLTSECNLLWIQNDGNQIALSGPYLSGLDGEYLLPEGCSATVVGCSTQNLIGSF